MSSGKKAQNSALNARIEQAQNIYSLGTLSPDGWVSAAALGVHERWEFFQRTACLHYPVRNKCERICSKGLVLKTPKIFVDAKAQEALEHYWSREMPQEFLKPVYTYCVTVGWCCATITPDRKYGAKPVCIPPTTPGLKLRWNGVGHVQSMLSRDEMMAFGTAGTTNAQGLITHVFGPLLRSQTGALGLATNSGTSGSLTMGDPTAQENTFDLKNIPPGFCYAPPHELVFISLSPWDPSLPGIRTPMDAIREDIEFWEETRRLWLVMLRERTYRPIVVAKPAQHGGNGKNDQLHDVDFIRGEMPECKDKDAVQPQAAPSALALQREREEMETRRANFIAGRWTALRNYQGKDPYKVLPPSMGGTAMSFRSPPNERRLKDGEVVQRTDAFPDLPDTSQISAHLNEQSCQSYGVPMSLGSRSSDSSQAKLWSTGGDKEAFRMYQQSCSQDCSSLEEVAKRMYVKCVGPDYVFSSAVRQFFEQIREEDRSDNANFRNKDQDGDTNMLGSLNGTGRTDMLPKRQRQMITREFKDEIAKDGKSNDDHLEELRKFEDQIRVVLLGNIEMEDVQIAADTGMMNFENYRLFFSANARVPLSMLEKEIQDPFRLKVAEKEADIDANAKAKAKAKTTGASSASK